MRNRRIAAIVLAVAMVCMTVAATSASARPQQAGTAKTADGQEGRGRRHLPRRLGVVVRLHRRLRPDRRVPRRGVRHLLEPARAHARRLQPRRRCTGQRRGARPRDQHRVRSRTAARPTRSTSSAASSSGRRSTARSRPRTSSARSSASARKSLVAQYGFYYDVIKGMTAFEAGKAKIISGITTPDPKTISLHLTKPTGDFLYRLGMPAAGPHPAGGRRVLHAAERVRPLRHLLGPVHDRRLGQAQPGELRHDHGLGRHLGLRRRDEPRPRPQPGLQPRDGQPEGA